VTTTYDKHTVSSAAMRVAGGDAPAATVPRVAHVLDLLAAAMDPTETEGIVPEDMYTHAGRWLTNPRLSILSPEL
jgi:hypothetical protein